MATQIAIGFSQAADPIQAAKEACFQAKNQADITSADLVIVFTTIHYVQPQILEVIHRFLQPKHLIGCSTAGIILADHVETKGISILAIVTDEIHFGVGAVSKLDTKDLRQAGFELARNTAEDFHHSHRQAFIFFADGLFNNNTMFLRGAQEVFGNSFPTVGAVSCDDFSFKKTYQYFQTQMMTSSAVGLLLSSQMNIILGNKHGWRPLGKPRTIDSVDGNIIKTIDGKPAAHIYEEYLGEEVRHIKTAKMGSVTTMYPLGIYLEEEKEYLLRNAVDILDDGSIVCQGEVPEGSEVHIMIGNKDSCKQAAFEAAQAVRDNLFGHQAKLILIFEGMSRLKVLGRHIFQEIQIIKDVLGYTTPMFGMFSYGEISPFGSLQNVHNTYLQNESIVILAIG